MSELIDLEKELIAHCALVSSAERIIKEDIPMELLVRPQTQQVIRFLQYYFTKSHILPTLEVLSTEFPDEEFNAPVSSIEYVLDKIRHRYKRAELYDLSLKLADMYGNDKIDEAMNLVHQKVADIDRQIMSSEHIWSLDDIPMFISKLQDKVVNTHNFKYYTLGFQEIDDFTGGYRPGQLLFLAARPKRQKSFVQIKTFYEQILQGRNPVYFTLELTHFEVMLRLLCMITGYSWNNAQKGWFPPGSWEMIQNGWTNFQERFNGRGHIIQPEERSVMALMGQAEKLQADSIFISQLKYIHGVKDYRNPYDKHAEVVHDLKVAATRPGKEIPIHVEAQLNREAKNIHELQELDLAQLGLTDAIGQVADAVYAITQGPGQRIVNVIEYGVLEARNHGKASWYVEYDYLSGCRLTFKEEVTP